MEKTILAVGKVVSSSKTIEEEVLKNFTLIIFMLLFVSSFGYLSSCFAKVLIYKNLANTRELNS